jgi:hypothetical protein
MFVLLNLERVTNGVTTKNIYKVMLNHSYDILGAGMLWKPKEARILTNFINQLVNIW